MKNIKKLAKQIISSYYTPVQMNFKLGPNILFNDGTTGITFNIGTNSIKMKTDEAEKLMNDLKKMIEMAKRDNK